MEGKQGFGKEGVCFQFHFMYFKLDVAVLGRYLLTRSKLST